MILRLPFRKQINTKRKLYVATSAMKISLVAVNFPDECKVNKQYCPHRFDIHEMGELTRESRAR